MSDAEKRERADLLKAKLAILEAEFQDVPLGAVGAVYIELMLETMCRGLRQWPTCEQFGRVAHEIYHGYTDQRAERNAAN